jgi:hypothetical protein
MEELAALPLSAHAWLAPTSVAVVMMRVEMRGGGEHETHPKEVSAEPQPGRDP